MLMKQRNGIEITANRKNVSGEGKAPVVLLLFLIAGVLSFLLFFKSLNSVDYSAWLILPAAIVFCWAIWHSFLYYKKWFFILLFVALLVCAFVVWLQWDVLWEQIIYVQGSLQGKAGLGNMQVTLLMLLFTVLFSFLIFTIEFFMKSHGLFYIITTLFLLLSPSLGIQMDLKTVFLLVLFQLTFWAIHLTRGRSRGVRPSVLLRMRSAGKSGIFIGIFFTVSFFVISSLVTIFSEQLYDSVYEAEGFVSRSIRYLTGSANELVTGGQISRGNNYRTGAEHLILTASLKPTETLYLCGFSGGEYIGGDWTLSDDEAFLEEMASASEQMLGRGMFGDLYDSMYYKMNSMIRRTEEVFTYRILIQHSNGKYENSYVPYYSQSQEMEWQGENLGYAYMHYEQKDVNIDWDNMAEWYLGQKNSYRKFQNSYMRQAKKIYTQVPVEMLPRLTALVKENPLTELDDITAFILYTLDSNASYNLMPGNSPVNQDIAEYFLFERKEGFCEHFAATATLMYRLYGIPARYVTGYRVLPSDFKLENGGFRAVITDESAHAWVEIFLENYGWTPIEVTPSDNRSIAVSYPGFDSVRLNQIWEERGWDVEKPSLAKENVSNFSEMNQGNNSNTILNTEIDKEKYRNLFFVLLICLGCGVLLLPFFLVCRRQRLQKNMDIWDCRAVFHRLMEALHFAGLLSGYTGSELDFARQFAEAVPVVSGEEAEKLAAIVSKAAFSPQKPDIKEDEFVRYIYRCTVRSIYAELTRSKKTVFRFIKAFE